MIKLNLDKLIKVRVNDLYPSICYYYQTHKPKKYFWQEERKEGVYVLMLGSGYVGDVPRGHVLNNGVVYEKPKVVMCFQSNIVHEKDFDTIEEANEFAKTITNDRKWLLT